MSNDIKEESHYESDNGSDNEDKNGYEADSFVVDDESESEYLEEEIL
jgi:hypothetical protein